MQDSQPTVNQKSPFSFSLLNFLLGTALLVAVISHVVASRQLNQVNAEVRKLRAELGFLNIEDPKKGYVIYVPQLEQNSYLFRIYLPPGHSYSRRFDLESKTQHGVSSNGGSGTIGESGEMTLLVKIFKNEAGEIQLAMQGLGSGSSMRFAKDSAIAAMSHSTRASTAPSKESKAFELGERVELLSLEVVKVGEPPAKDILKIWLEDTSAPPANVAGP